MRWSPLTGIDGYSDGPGRRTRAIRWELFDRQNGSKNNKGGNKMKTYYVYSIDQYGYQNHGSHSDIASAFHHCDLVRKKQKATPYVSDHREGLTRICRCGNPVWGQYGEWTRCKKCYNDSCDAGEMSMLQSGGSIV